MVIIDSHAPPSRGLCMQRAIYPSCRLHGLAQANASSADFANDDARRPHTRQFLRTIRAS